MIEWEADRVIKKYSNINPNHTMQLHFNLNSTVEMEIDGVKSRYAVTSASKNHVFLRNLMAVRPPQEVSIRILGRADKHESKDNIAEILFNKSPNNNG